MLATGGALTTITLYYGPVDGGTNSAAWSNSAGIGIQFGVYSKLVTGLTSNKMYFFTAKAVNSFGTSWAPGTLNFLTLGVTMTPQVVTGFNRDVVVENSATGPPFSGAALELSPGEGTAFYQSGLSNQAYGLPVSGNFTSAMGDGTTFQFQPYTSENALVLGSETGLTNGALAFGSPATFSRIAILANSAGGGGPASVTLNFADGSAFVTNYSAADWFANSVAALQGVDRIDLTTGIADGASNSYPRFYQTTLDIASAMGDSNKPLASLTFAMAAANATAVYAVSGLTTNSVVLPQLTNAVAVVQATAATLGGAVISAGGETPAVTLYYGPSDGGTNPVAWANSIFLGRQAGFFSQSVTGLTTNSAYFFSSKAVNTAGIVWASPSRNFTTLASALPVITNLPATGVHAAAATLSGQVLAAGNDPPSIVIFYGETDGGTNEAAWSNSVSIGTQTGSYSQLVGGLSSNTTYFFTSRAVNSAATAWAVPSLAFKTLITNPPPLTLKPFPLSASQRGTVDCLENPAVSYDIYLPPAYSTNGPPLPILYTLNPGGGGMVSDFQAICSSLNVIAVGITGSANGVAMDPVLREFYADALDIRQRVLFDPTAEFVAGFSGGGENSYIFSRLRAQHVSGLLEMAGWLGRINTGPSNVTYYSNDRVQTNLYIARTTGLSDTAALFYLPYDSNYLTSCGAVIKDWYFSGGHTTPPDSMKFDSLSWLLSQRKPGGQNDAFDSSVRAADWRWRAASGQTGTVLKECVATLMNQPRTWFALEAQLVIDDLMTNYNSFRLLNASNLFAASSAFTTNNFSTNINYWSPSDFASDFFYYTARGAVTNGDRQRYDSCLKALTGVASVNGDRLGHIFTMLTTSGYPGPILHMALSPTFGQTTLSIDKDTPSLSYNLQRRNDLINDSWQNIFPQGTENDTTWSATFDLDSSVTAGFYRMSTRPALLGSSPPWPPL